MSQKIEELKIYGLYAILVFPRFSIAVKCAVAGSFVATGV
jgi:hypothetical protein